jgi:ELWxxDGT repeat protein
VAPIELINLNGTLLYQGTDGGTAGKHGVELWRSDGTEAGTVLVKDINPGVDDSYPSRPTKVGNYVVFLATPTGLTPVNSELWRTDGTTAGTAIVEDINPGAGGLDTSPPPRPAVLGSAVLFGADDGTNGVELWKAVDTIAPTTTIDSGPAEGQAIATRAPTFAFSSDDPPSSFQCSVDGAGFAACASPQSTAALSAGAHSFAVRAIDAAGNVDASPATRTFTVKDPPETTIDSGPADGGPTTDTTPTFGFSSNDSGAGFECRVDGGTFAACTSPTTTGELSPGAHTFSVRAIDSLAQADPTPATRNFTVTQAGDKDPPETTIDKQPKPKTTKRKAKFSISSSEPGSTFECKLDKGDFERCDAKATFKVKPGKHRAEFRAIDPAGNVDQTPAVAKWKVKKPV